MECLLQAEVPPVPAPEDDLSATQIRELTPGDLRCGFLEALASLSAVDLTPEQALPVFHERRRAGIRTFVACREGEVVGTASLVLERKFIHGGGLAGHVEDVAVRKGLQSRGIGSALVRHVTEEAHRLGCYKVILDCSAKGVPFYSRFGYYWHEYGMRHDNPADVPKQAG
jgi:glucosamine-phosphate N-acetyltransferase